MERIHIIGPAGSGKTSLGREIEAALHIPHVELDSIFWQDDWQSLDVEDFRRAVSAALSGERWVVDGNYSKVRDIVWARAQVILWLDYPFLLVFRQLLKRTIRRALSRELLWGNNRESLIKSFLSRDSLLLYFLQTYKKKRQQYVKLSVSPELSHLQFVQLRHPRQTRQWLAGQNSAQD